MRDTAKWLALGLLAGYAATGLAAVELNTATVAELDGIKGIGPSLSRAILAERQQAPFSSWSDFIQRVHGVKEASAIRLSNQGLTVQGQRYSGPAVRPVNPP